MPAPSRPLNVPDSVDSSGNPRSHPYYQERLRRDAIMRENASRTFHLLPELPQELRILIWKYAIEVAAEYDIDHELIGDHKRGPRLPMASEHADSVQDTAYCLPTFNSLMWVCRLSRQISLERWKKNIEDELRKPPGRRGLAPGAPREVMHREILKDVNKELERLKN